MRFREPIERGDVTLQFRRWKRCQVVAGNKYRTPAGRIWVDKVEVVDPAKITKAQAQRAGVSLEDLQKFLRGDDAIPVYRITIRPAEGPDERDELAADAALSADDVADIAQRLARLDKASAFGPWTHDTLRKIAEKPGVRAPDLAAEFGRETAPFKLDVRKLKNLGLTRSLTVGYELSPRGRAFLDGYAS
jgi:hypothetical protein